MSGSQKCGLLSNEQVTYNRDLAVIDKYQQINDCFIDLTNDHKLSKFDIIMFLLLYAQLGRNLK